jgi:hypothetical protein
MQKDINLTAVSENFAGCFASRNSRVKAKEGVLKMRWLAVSFALALAVSATFAESPIKAPVKAEFIDANGANSNKTGSIKDDYFHVKDGHIYKGDQRIKFWGANVNRDRLTSHKQIDGVVARIKAMGFNSVRLWPNNRDCFVAPNAKSVQQFRQYIMGDNSNFDLFDYMMYRLKTEGLYIRSPALHSIPTDLISVQDYDIIPPKDDEQDQRQQWLDGIKHSPHFTTNLFYVDERLQALEKQYISNFLNHINPYTGTRYALESAIALYEIHNEDQFAVKLGFYFQDWPEYFKKEFMDKWDKFTQAKTGTSRKIEVFPKDANDTELWYEFLYSLINNYKQQMIAHVRSHAPKGYGCSVTPVTVDCVGFQTLTTIYPESLGDYASASIYFGGVNMDKSNPHAPWISYLYKPPVFTDYYSGGLEALRIKDKPFVIYETGEVLPARYRAEYPMRMATYGSWQDYDGIFFYIFITGLHEGDTMLYKNEDYLKAPLAVSNKQSMWLGCQFAADEILLSQLKAAGQIFLNGYIKPAQHPTTFTFGKKYLFSDFASRYLNGNQGQINEKDHYPAIRRTSTLYGARVAVDPSWDGTVKTEGPIVEDEFKSSIQPSEQFVWDWPNGRLIIDTPQAKVAAGFLGKQVEFKDGVTVKNINREFACIALVSQDGKPIVESDRIIFSAVNESCNTGFEFKATEAPKQVPEDMIIGQPFEEVLKSVVDPGIAPVIVNRVACELTLPGANGRKAKMIDFALRNFKTEDADRGVVLRAEDPVFYCEITKGR